MGAPPQLSWWIRPLFLIPFAFFAYRRSWLGIAVTLVALATSMFWFPRPARGDPQVAEFLAAERRAVLGEWTLPKVVMLASIPAFFLGVGAAFWRRALWLAVLLIGLGALMKVVWSFAIGDDSARTLVPPAVFTFLVTALAVALGTGRLRRRSTS
ncbi:MAG TPA: hypothetical protein VE528_01340 [Thermoleophilaceae bacterium]|nr:hypothetical protein [Thermoleophilaceae bacterium]